MSTCERPISWLLLERYHLGEISPAERERVDEHLDGCEVCKGDLGAIESDVRPLPPLEEVQARGLWTSFRFAWAAGALAVLLVAIFVWTIASVGSREVPPRRIAYKGGELALVVVRDRAGARSEDPARFADGDRFKVLVTCPPGGPVAWEVVIFQGREAYFPFAATQELSCGNRVPLAGAFALTGAETALICFLVGDGPLSREQIAAGGVFDLGEGVVCAELLAVPGR